jgi:hypothetical protein
MPFVGLKLRDVNGTVGTADSRTLRYRDRYPIAGPLLGRGCRNEEGEGCKDESKGEVHLYERWLGRGC